MRAYRKKADYEHEPIDLDVGSNVARADRFIDDMEAFC